MGSKNSEVNEEQEPADMNALHGLLRNVSIVLNVKREIDKNEKFDDCFTVFSALNIENLELKHCQMIANLLNPDGKHGMGTTFLNLFFKIVLDKQIADNDHPKIYTEYDTKNAGRMDLYIETETACYPIEVKIKAGDQDCQLSRYYKYVEKKSDNNLTIFYLTLDGHKPSEKSVNGLTEKDLNNVKRKSFEKHIIPWLKKCAELSYKYPNVYSAIHQYITLIEKLTLKSKEEKLQEDLIMTSIKDIISLSGQYFNAAKEIAEHFENVQPDKMKDIFRKIKAHMSKYNLSCRYEQDKIRKFYFGGKKNKEDSSPSLEFELCKHDDIVLNLVFAICGKAEEDDQFYYGIRIGFLSDKTNEVKYDKDLFQKRKDVIANIFTNKNWKIFVEAIKNGSWVWWKNLPSKSEEPNFRTCNDNYLKLYNPADYEQIMNKIFEEVDSNLEFINKNGVPPNLLNVRSHLK